MLTHFADPEYRLKHWGVMSTVMFALGWIISPFWAMNKQLWSPAYVHLVFTDALLKHLITNSAGIFDLFPVNRYLFFMAGSCGYLLIALYVVYDLEFVAPVSRWMRPLQTAFMPCVRVSLPLRRATRTALSLGLQVAEISYEGMKQLPDTRLQRQVGWNEYSLHLPRCSLG